MKQQSKKTIYNNLNSFKLISKLYQAESIEVIDRTNIKLVGVLLTNDKRSLKMLSTLNGYLSHFVAMVRGTMGIEEFSVRLDEENNP